MNETKPFVFISYAHKDSELVMPVLRQMQAQGITLWYDEGIVAGSEWPEFVADKVVNCDRFVLFVSKAYLESQNCKRELNFAISRQKEILSIFLEDVVLSPGVEMQLGTYQAIFRKRFSDTRQFHAIVAQEPFFYPCRAAAQSTQTTNDTTPPPSPPPKSQLPYRNKKLAAWLAVLLCIIGGHKFYLRQYLLGLIYLALYWTPVPLVLSLIEAFLIFRQSDEAFAKRYKCRVKK